MRKCIFQQSKLPAFNSRFGKRLAKALWELKLYFADGRREREEWVYDCDAAYMCHRYVPNNEGIQLIEDGEFGESDIFDNTNVVSIRLALALMPRNEPWLTVSSRESEADSIVQGLTDHQMFLHRKAKTRRNVQKAIKQGIVRGTMAIYYDWHDEYRKRRMTNDEHAKEIVQFLADQGLNQKDAKRFARGRYNELTFSGPVIQPVDFYDLWIDPSVDITNNRYPGTILQRFRHLSALKSEVDDDDKPVYSNLEDIEPYPLEDLYSNNDLAGGRHGSDRLFHSGKGNTYQSGIKMVPVYIFHLPYFELDGYEFWDTYFHVAISRKGERARLIRIEENPSNSGLNHLIIDHYIDNYVQEPYGISGVQFQIHKYNTKNYMQLLTVTGATHGVVPPNLVYEAAFRDEDELSWAAGYNNYVQENPFGLDVVKRMDMSPNGTMLGEQMLRFMADEIRAGTGVDGLSTNNAARTDSRERTATEINSDNTAGSFFLDNQAENLQDMLTELTQGTFELTQQNAKPSADNPNQLEYEKYLGDKSIMAMLQLSDLQAKRSVTVRGITGQLNKEQEMGNLQKLFQTAGQINDPRMNPVKMYLAQKMAAKLNVPLPQELLMDPIQLVATNPQAQQAAFEMAMQNPEIQQIIGQMMSPGPVAPEGAPQDDIGQAQPIN